MSAAAALLAPGVTPREAVFRVPLPRVQTALRELSLCCVHGHGNLTGHLGYLSETIMLHRNETAVSE